MNLIKKCIQAYDSWTLSGYILRSSWDFCLGTLPKTTDHLSTAYSQNMIADRQTELLLKLQYKHGLYCICLAIFQSIPILWKINFLP